MFRSAQDALNGVAKLVFTILSAVAEMEREQIGERVRSLKQHLRQGGYFTGGKLARGYQLTNDGKLVADENWQDCLTAMKTDLKPRWSFRLHSQSAEHQLGAPLRTSP